MVNGSVCTHAGTVSPISLFMNCWLLLCNAMILRLTHLKRFVLGNVFSHLRGFV